MLIPSLWKGFFYMPLSFYENLTLRLKKNPFNPFLKRNPAVKLKFFPFLTGWHNYRLPLAPSKKGNLFFKVLKTKNSYTYG